jgi:hypothetical protein
VDRAAIGWTVAAEAIADLVTPTLTGHRWR